MLSREEIRRFPKVDLHRHLDGDIRPDVVFHLAKKEDIGLPVSRPEELAEFFCELNRKEDLSDLFQKGFGLITSLMQNKENLSLIGYEEVRNLWADGIAYAEIRFAPQYHTGESEYYGHSRGNKPLSYSDVIRAVGEGLKEGEKDFGVSTNMIVCIGREVESDVGVDIVDAALACVVYDGVVGIDLACDEASYPPERHVAAYKKTFNSLLRRTVHAGEMGNESYRYKNIVESIISLRADRLGHAWSLARHNGLIELVTNRAIGIEMCPLGYVISGSMASTRELELQSLLDREVMVTINSDDPAMFGFTLTDVFYRIMQDYNFSKEVLARLVRNAIRVSFLGGGAKNKLFSKLDAAM